MTRKDYELIAEVFRYQLDRNEETLNNIRSPDLKARVWARNQGIHDVLDHLAARLAAENPRFDRAKFLRAAGDPEAS